MIPLLYFNLTDKCYFEKIQIQSKVQLNTDLSRSLKRIISLVFNFNLTKVYIVNI